MGEAKVSQATELGDSRCDTNMQKLTDGVLQKMMRPEWRQEVESTGGQGLSKWEFYCVGNKANHGQMTSHRIKTFLRSGNS